MQPEEPKEPSEPKPAAKEPEDPKPGPKPKQDQDIHRVLWERTRLSRAFEVLAVQGVLWGNLFVFSRGTYTGLGAIIPFAISIVLVTYLLISLTRFGKMVDIAIMLFFSFSSLAATFSTLYWNYGTTGNFTERLTQLDAIYFTIGTLTTAGTGNISAISQVARGLQTLQMVLDIGFILFAVSLVVSEISSRMQRRRDHQSN
jgi:hypothetical protein